MDLPNEELIKNEIRREIERIHETATYASETQFEYAKRWRRVDRWIGGASAVTAAVAGVGGLSDLMTAQWAGFIAVVAAGMGAIAASIGAPQTKEKAAGSANEYRSLQQDCRVLMNIDLRRLPIGDARQRLDELIKRVQQLNSEAEIPSGNAWKRAQKQIEDGAQKYEADKQ